MYYYSKKIYMIYFLFRKNKNVMYCKILYFLCICVLYDDFFNPKLSGTFQYSIWAIFLILFWHLMLFFSNSCGLAVISIFLGTYWCIAYLSTIYFKFVLLRPSYFFWNIIKVKFSNSTHLINILFSFVFFEPLRCL